MGDNNSCLNQDPIKPGQICTFSCDAESDLFVTCQCDGNSGSVKCLDTEGNVVQPWLRSCSTKKRKCQFTGAPYGFDNMLGSCTAGKVYNDGKTCTIRCAKKNAGPSTMQCDNGNFHIVQGLSIEECNA